MTKVKLTLWRKYKLLLLAPAVFALVLMCTKSTDENRGIIDYHDSQQLAEIKPSVTDNPGKRGEVFFVVEEMPEFKGKKADEFRNYIAQNIKYPVNAKENGIQGRVFVQFTVAEDGTVTDAKIVRGADPLLDEEALRVVRSSPTWTAGRQGGEPVMVAFTFPINFVLQGE